MVLRWKAQIERSLLRSIATLTRLRKARGHVEVMVAEATCEACADAAHHRLRSGGVPIEDPHASEVLSDLARADAAGTTPSGLATMRVAAALPLTVDPRTDNAP